MTRTFCKEMKTLLTFIPFFVFSVSCLASANLRIKGSDTLGAKMVPQLVEAYRELHPAMKFEIAAEGSSSCFEALWNASCDIGMASRPVSEEEAKRFITSRLVLKDHVVAHDMIVVIVNADNLVKNLSLKEVEQVFTGDIDTWNQLGGRGQIVAITRNASSGTYKTFQKLAMDGREYGKRTQKLAGGESLPAEVSKNANAIGYCGLSYATKEGIRAVPIDGVKPSVKRVRDYPVSRDLFFYTVGDISPEVKKFIEWVQNSKKARGIIERVGFIPLQPHNQEAEQGGAEQPATRSESKRFP